MVVSLVFLQFWHLWNTQRQFFGLFMRFGDADGSWEFWVFDFVIYVSEICRFLCLSLKRSFVVHFFFIFQDIVWLVKSTWCVRCCSIHHFYWVSNRCRSEFALWWFFVRKKLQMGSFSFLLVLTIRHSLSFHKFEKQSCLFGVDNAFFVCWCYPGVLNFRDEFFSVESCLFMFQSVMRFFSLQVFPFLIKVRLILSFRCAHFYSFIPF